MRDYLQVGLALGLFVLVVLWYVMRTKGGSAIAAREFHLSRLAEERLDNMLTSWLRAQESERTLGVTEGVFDAFWVYLRRGVYVMWYHRARQQPRQPL